MNIAIIPARIKSQRLPRKLLLPVNNKPLIQYTWENALKIPNVEEVYIATKDIEIARVASDFGAKVLIPEEHVSTGTEMVLAAGRLLDLKNNCKKNLINIQGEWVSVNPNDISNMVRHLSNCDEMEVCSLFYRDRLDDNPNKVKVVLSNCDGELYKAIYFSRHPIPYGSKFGCFHVGVYAFNDAFRKKYNQLTKNKSLDSENLEQLSWLQAGITIKMFDTSLTFGIDTKKDFKNYVKIINQDVSGVERFLSQFVYHWKWSYRL